MKVATTIQISPEEDKDITSLKHQLKLPTKKAVVLEGLSLLKEAVLQRERSQKLREASLATRKTSAHVNREWAPISTSTRSA